MPAKPSAVVVPTYNEARNIERLIGEIHLVMADMDILVVDDDSPDGTGRIVAQLAEKDQRIRLMSRPGKLGLGTAYVAGFTDCLERGYSFICQMDSDFSHQPHYLADFMREIEGADLVLGSRYVPGGRTEDWGLKRKILSLGGNLYARTILSVPFHDLTGGFKCFRREVLEAIDLSTVTAEGYAFQMETTFRAWRRGFRVLEIPIVFPDRTLGQSKLSNGIFWESLAMPWRLRIKG